MAQCCRCVAVPGGAAEEEAGRTPEAGPPPRLTAPSTTPSEGGKVSEHKKPTSVAFSPPTDLQGRVALDVLGTFDDGEVGEAKLVRGLDQAHATAPHLQQHLADAHRRRVLAAGHLHTAAAVRNANPSPHAVRAFGGAGNKPVEGRCPPGRRCPSGRSQRCSAPPPVPARSSGSPTLAP